MGNCYQQRQGVYQLVDQAGNFERKTDKDERIECLNQRVKVLENLIEEIGATRVTKAAYIVEQARTIKMNGGKGVCTGATICPFMGKPHVDVSKTVFAGK
nr:hypothetical protein [Photobacterium aquae]